MWLKVSQPFSRTSKWLRFEDDVLTKAQMLSWTDNQYSDWYLVIDKDTYDLYIYKAGATPSATTWKFVKVETWWWSSWEVWETFTTNVKVWWLEAWTTINDTDTITSVLKQMLIMYIAPAITCAITPNKTLYKKWETVNITKLSATATKNSNPITQIEFKQGNTVLETLTTWVADWWAFDCSQTIAPITTNTTLSATVTDWTETKTASKSIEFINAFYYWPSATATIDSTTWLTEDLTKKANKTYTYTTNNEYVTIIYDNSYWALTSIKDQNWFEWISWFNTWTFTEWWQTFKYYISQLATTDTWAKYTFTF